MASTRNANSDHTSSTALLPSLHLTRLCGEFGPVLFCCGELSVATEEVLRRELAFLEPLGHPVLTLDLTGCDFLDTEAAFTLFAHCARWGEHGHRLVVITGTGQPARLLRVTGIERGILAFPSADQAALSLGQAGPAAHAAGPEKA